MKEIEYIVMTNLVAVRQMKWLLRTECMHMSGEAGITVNEYDNLSKSLSDIHERLHAMIKIEGDSDDEQLRIY